MFTPFTREERQALSSAREIILDRATEIASRMSTLADSYNLNQQVIENSEDQSEAEIASVTNELVQSELSRLYQLNSQAQDAVEFIDSVI
jgi:uncharacterized protein Yka (UPF0111/DUF47 family)